VTTADSLVSLTEAISSALQSVIDDGFSLPIHGISVSANSSLLVGRYERSPDGLNCVVLAERIEDSIYKCPIHIMFTSADGRAAHMLIRSPTKRGKPSLQIVSPSGAPKSL
jgi:hypothetical protein